MHYGTSIAAELDRVRAADAVPPFEAIVRASGRSRGGTRGERAARRHQRDRARCCIRISAARRSQRRHSMKHAQSRWAIRISNSTCAQASAVRATRTRASCFVQITGAQDALVVNNCAAAILLILDTFARDARSRARAQSAHRDRRRLPSARRARAQRRDAGRGRHHQQSLSAATTSARSRRARRC